MSKRRQLHRHSLPIITLSIGVLIVTILAVSGLSASVHGSKDVIWRALIGRSTGGQSNDQADNAGTVPGQEGGQSGGPGLGQLTNTGQTAVELAGSARAAQE